MSSNRYFIANKKELKKNNHFKQKLKKAKFGISKK